MWQAGGQLGVPYPGPRSAASGFLLPGLGGPGHLAQLGWAPPSSPIQSQKLWMGPSWGLKDTVGFSREPSPLPRIHPVATPTFNVFVTLTSRFHQACDAPPSPLQGPQPLTIGRNTCPPAPASAPVAAPIGPGSVEGGGGALVGGVPGLVTAAAAPPAPGRAEAQSYLPELLIDLEPLQAKLLHLLGGQGWREGPEE